MNGNKKNSANSPLYTLFECDGLISLRHAQSGEPLWMAHPKIEIDGTWAELKKDCAGNSSGRWTAGNLTLDLLLLETAGDFISLGLTVKTHGSMRIGKLVLSMDIPGLVAGRKFLGFNSGLPSGDGICVLQEDDAGTESPSSNLVAVLAPHGESPCLLFGSSGTCNDPSYFKVDAGRMLAGFDASRNVSGQLSCKLVFGTGTCPFSLLEAYGDILKDISLRVGNTPTGWNSWDYYGGAVSMAELRAEMAAINASPLKGRLKYFTIDMGWEETWGVWQTNRRFPKSLSSVARKIQDEGFIPGIWTAPLQVGRFTELARNRQDLFVRHSDGNLFIDEKESPVGHMLMLDYSKDEVCELVGSWFRGMRNAGFRLFKIDYIYGYYLKQLQDTDIKLGRTEFARRIIQTIRKAVGEDSHIVNCGAPPEAAIGLADSSRVSMDIHNFWGHIRNSARQAGNRYWMNKRLWTIDPDFAIIRNSTNTSDRYLNMPYRKRPLQGYDDFWMAGDEASNSEVMVWLSLVRLVGGSLFLSDSIARLNQTSIETLSKLFPPMDVPARPIDLFENSPAKLWHSSDPKAPTLGIFNWDDTASSVILPENLDLPQHGRDFWTGRQVKLSRNMELPPRSCLLLEY